MKQNTKNRRGFTRTPKLVSGFTLIEALVAISILMIAIATPMTISQKGLSDAVLSKNETIASFLAQDGIEGVKNLRDNTALSAASGGNISGGWLVAFNGTTGANCICTDSAPQSCATNFTNYCNIDTTTFPVPTLFASSSTPVKANPMNIVRDASGNFLYFNLGTINPPSTEPNSIFSRYINIVQSPTNPNEARINIKVSWNEPSGPQSVMLSDFIYNYSANL